MHDLALEERLLAAHAARDLRALISLYSEASEMAALAGEAKRAAFFRTQAMVFALDLGDPIAEDYRTQLAAEGRA